MNLLDEEFRAHPEWDAHLLMTVHDELVAECLAEHVEVVAKAVEASMIKGGEVYMKKCPVKVDVKIGDHWSK